MSTTLSDLLELVFTALGDDGYPGEPSMATVPQATRAINRTLRDLTYQLEASGAKPLLYDAEITVAADTHTYDLDSQLTDANNNPNWRRIWLIERTDGDRPIPVDFPRNGDFVSRNVGRWLGYPSFASIVTPSSKLRMYTKGTLIGFIDEDNHGVMTLTVYYAPFVPKFSVTNTDEALSDLGLDGNLGYLTGWEDLIADLAALRLFTNTNSGQYIVAERGADRDMSRFLTQSIKDHRIGGHRAPAKRWGGSRVRYGY